MQKKKTASLYYGPAVFSCLVPIPDHDPLRLFPAAFSSTCYARYLELIYPYLYNGELAVGSTGGSIRFRFNISAWRSNRCGNSSYQADSTTRRPPSLVTLYTITIVTAKDGCILNYPKRIKRSRVKDLNGVITTPRSSISHHKNLLDIDSFIRCN